MEKPDSVEQVYLPRRAVHLDFHTGPAIPDVGRDFDPESFAQAFAEAHVDSVTVFAKCHHGHLYYDTSRSERHPALPKDLDLLSEQISALHSVGIRAPIYLSVQVDEYAANTNPDWVALHPDLRQVKRANSAFEAGWQILDMSSPYQDYLAEQIVEVLDRFAPVDGVFLDMCWDQPSASKWAVDGMRGRGLEPADERDRDRYARMVAHEYMERFRSLIDDRHRGGPPVPVWFNSRPKTNLHDERKLMRHVEIESLPTGGWGYAYTPYVARFVRPLGLPTLGMTGRFHKSWGDNAGLKPAAALKYECCQLLSLGLGTSVGDLLHPRGVPHRAAYKMIGDVFSHLEACESHLADATVVSEVALIVDPELGDRPGPAGLGAVRLLQQLRQQFDVVPPDADLSRYALVILPETTSADDNLKASLRRHIAGGGALLVAGTAALDGEQQPILAELGIAVEGPSPYSHVFLRPTGELRAMPGDVDIVVYERGLRLRPADESTVLAGVVEPYFERTYDHFSGHSYTPPDQVSPYAGIVQKGNVITLAVPLLEAFGKHANVLYREILGACIDRLLPTPLLRDNGPAHLEATYSRANGRTVVHLLSYLPSRQSADLDLVMDPFPLVNMAVSVRMENAFQRATLEPSGQPVEAEYRDGYAHANVTVLDGHAMLVFS